MLKACLGKSRVVTSICSGPDEQLIHIVNILPAIWASSALQERLGDLTSSVTRCEHEGRVDNSPWVLECETMFQPLPLPSPALIPALPLLASLPLFCLSEGFFLPPLFSASLVCVGSMTFTHNQTGQF